METLIKYLPVFIPIIALQLFLAVIALVHVWRHPHYRFGNRVIWVIIVCFVQILGPVIYFTIGRGEE